MKIETLLLGLFLLPSLCCIRVGSEAPRDAPAPIEGTTADDVDDRLFGQWVDSGSELGTGHSTWTISDGKIEILKKCRSSLAKTSVNAEAPVRIEKGSITVLEAAEKRKQNWDLVCTITVGKDSGTYKISEDGNSLEIDWGREGEEPFTLTRE